jgi:hypothetical protein
MVSMTPPDCIADGLKGLPSEDRASMPQASSADDSTPVSMLIATPIREAVRGVALWPALAPRNRAMLTMTIQNLICNRDAQKAVHLTWLVLRHAIARARHAIAVVMQRAAENRELQALDWRMRRDISLGSCEMHVLVRKPIWRA